MHYKPRGDIETREFEPGIMSPEMLQGRVKHAWPDSRNLRTGQKSDDKLQRRHGGFDPLEAGLPRADQNGDQDLFELTRIVALTCMVSTVMMRDMENDGHDAKFPEVWK